MPNHKTTQELISEAVNTTVATVSITLQQKVAERLMEVLAGDDPPQKKVKKLNILLGELKEGVMEYD